MNWKATAAALLAIGVAVGAAGMVWANRLHSKAHDCRLSNVYGSINAALDEGRTFRETVCGTSTPGWILAGIGGGVVLLAVALLIGATSRTD